MPVGKFVTSGVRGGVLGKLPGNKISHAKVVAMHMFFYWSLCFSQSPDVPWRLGTADVMITCRRRISTRLERSSRREPKAKAEAAEARGGGFNFGIWNGGNRYVYGLLYGVLYG